MITTDEKIKVFKKIINEDIEANIEQEISEIKEQKEDEVTKYKLKKYEDIEKMKKEYQSKLESKKDSIISKAQKEGQDIVLAANKKIYEEFFKELREKLKADYSGEKGEKYINAKLQEIAKDVKATDTVYIFDGTADRDKKIIASVLPGAKVEISKSIKLGGFEVENGEKTYKINYSLDFLLDSEYRNILTKVKNEIGIM